MNSKTVRKLIVGIFAICLIIIAIPKGALGSPGNIIIDDDNGLEVHVPTKTEDTGNLNPGDRNYSNLKLKNTSNNILHVYMKTNILSEKSPKGGYLIDVMELTIKVGNEIIISDTFKDVAEEGSIYIGEIAPRSQKTINFSTDLPTNIGNKYQGSSFKANWTFTTQTKGSSENGDKPSKPSKRPKKDDGSAPIIDEPVLEEPTDVIVPPEDSETIVIDDEIIPTGPTEMPATGEIPPYYYYGVGALTIIFGMAIRKDNDRLEE